MPTLDASWSPQIRKIGELERPDHWWLKPDHNCYFFGEYTARMGYGHSSTNQIIHNLKKKPSTKGTSQWQHKITAMKMIAAAMRAALNPQSLASVTIIPIPPSKLRADPEYDARIAVIGKLMAPDSREIIEAVIARNALHESDHRLRPDELRATLALVPGLCAPPPTQIILVDDVVTTGSSYVACHDMLHERFPEAKISGVFAARRAVDRTFPTL